MEDLLKCTPCTKKKIVEEREDAVASFLHMMKEDPASSPEDLFDLWKTKDNEKEVRIEENKMKISCSHRGLATVLHAECDHCACKHEINPKLSRYANLDWTQLMV